MRSIIFPFSSRNSKRGLPACRSEVISDASVSDEVTRRAGETWVSGRQITLLSPCDESHASQFHEMGGVRVGARRCRPPVAVGGGPRRRAAAGTVADAE